MSKVVRVTVADGKFTADATWLSGSPPIARGWSTQELAIAVLRDMIACDNTPCIKYPDEKPWGEWPTHYNVEVECD
jgi:hypothetical protein